MQGKGDEKVTVMEKPVDRQVVSTDCGRLFGEHRSRPPVALQRQGDRLFRMRSC